MDLVGITRHRKSLQAFPEAVRDPREEQTVESFRSLLLQDVLLPKEQSDYNTLLRFLRVRGFDLMKAKEMFLKYLKWREEFRVDIIVKEFRFEEHRDVKKFYPHGFHGVDKYGRPLYMERIGMMDLNCLMQITTYDRLLKYHVTEQEKTLRWRHPACSVIAKKHIAHTTSVFDVKDIGASNFSKPARDLFLGIQKIDSNYYPDTLHRLFIVNAGPGFRVLWQGLKVFFQPHTLAKIQVLGSNYQTDLAEVVEPSNLPSFLGGTCTCSDHGGCLSTDKGPWNDPEIKNMLQIDSKSEFDNGRSLGSMDSEEVLVSDMRNVPIEEEYNMTPTRDGHLKQHRKGDVHKALWENLEAFEDAIRDASRKIEALEIALKDTKMVLQELQQQMEELKRMNSLPLSNRNII